MIKAVVVFLLIMAVIGIIGNALFPGAMARQVKSRMRGKNRLGAAKSATCKACGRYVIGAKGCDCKKG